MNELNRLLDLVPKRPTGKATYDSILEAAEEIFVKTGVDEATVTSIIQRAGVSNQSLYAFFPDGKKSIAIILIHMRNQRMRYAMHIASEQLKLQAHAEENPNVPAYAWVQTMLSTMNMVRDEKRELDHQLIVWMTKHHYNLYNQRTLHTIRLIKRSMLDVLSYANIRPEDAEEAAFVMVMAVKGVSEGAVVLNRDTHPHVWISLLTQAFSSMVANLIQPGGACAGCTTIRALNAVFPQEPMETEHTRVTDLYPQSVPGMPPGMLRLLRNLQDPQ